MTRWLMAGRLATVSSADSSAPPYVAVSRTPPAVWPAVNTPWPLVCPSAMATVVEDSEPRSEAGVSAMSTEAPSAGAGRSSVTVNDCVALKNTVAVEGVSATSFAGGGVTVRSDVRVIPSSDADTVPAPSPSASAVKRNVASVAPAGTVTVAGTVPKRVTPVAGVATSATARSAVGAEDSTTRYSRVWPYRTTTGVEGSSDTSRGESWSSVTAVLALLAPTCAVTVPWEAEAASSAVKVNVACVAFFATVSVPLAGVKVPKPAAGSTLSAMDAFAGAGRSSATVSVTVPPGTMLTVAGDRVVTSACSVAPSTRRDDWSETVPRVAVSVTLEAWASGSTFTSTEVRPAGMVTFPPGTIRALGSLDVTVTSTGTE